MLNTSTKIGVYPLATIPWWVCVARIRIWCSIKAKVLTPRNYNPTQIWPIGLADFDPLQLFFYIFSFIVNLIVHK
jgi:hypothetical protein